MSVPKAGYIDRQSGELCYEIVYGERELQFLYYHPLGRLLRRLIAIRPWFSRLHSAGKKSPRSRAQIADFIERYQVNAGEAEMPWQDYPDLDTFFCRRLRRDTRPICRTPGVLVSPADGRVLAHRLTRDATFTIKRQTVAAAELLGNAALAAELSGGWALVVRLAPKDYHRFHFPSDGLAGTPVWLPGPLESVHPLALATGARSFRNRRCVTHLASNLGTIYMVEVGALTVGTIEQTYTPGPVSAGDEKGLFRFGGSTVVLLWGSKGPPVDADIQANSANELETLVNFGTQVATLHNSRNLS